ncbi:hypothetical protein [Rhizobium alvei]|uniref:Uncharacterized protein n=1 Tax=Rhizobium alvei TaxID=1132659 RepID=A0ABT8YT48_9HYPH|nr:hypothetical protein [Rhizobium alvei]MDO6966943.1 hypothetical protein [Rhizobium alvei]
MYDQFINGAKSARKLAAECADEARTSDTKRATYLMAESRRHIERAEDYEMRASLCVKDCEQEIAA